MLLSWLADATPTLAQAHPCWAEANPNAPAAWSQTITLADDRTLGFAEFGARDGTPVFYFVGGNSSRLEGRWLDADARDANVRLIVPDRPGFGASDFVRRSLMDWPADVAALADAIAVERFGVLALSGGGPHALATAYARPERITRVAVVSGLAPPDMPNRYEGMWFPVRTLFFLNRWAPPLGRFALGQMSSFYADPEQMRERMLGSLPEADVALMTERPEIIDQFSAAAREAHCRGIEGDAWEWQLYLEPWAFALDAIESDVALWYGAQDGNAPVGMGRYLHQAIPESVYNEVDAGHFSTLLGEAPAILRWLVEEPVAD